MTKALIHSDVAAILAGSIVLRVPDPESVAAGLEQLGKTIKEPSAAAYAEAATFIREQIKIRALVDPVFTGIQPRK